MQSFKQDGLLELVLMQNTSISWCHDQLSSILKEIKMMEGSGKEHILDLVRYNEVYGKYYYLLNKALFERRELLKLKEKVKKSC